MELPQTMDARASEAARTCRELLGTEVIGWEDPGGQRRKSTRLFLGERSVIATMRDSATRADLEAGVLESLHKHGAAVPAVLAFDGRWLLQEDIGGVRLSRQLRTVDKAEAFDLQERALASLHGIHEAARRAGLARQCAAIGSRDGWLNDLIATSQRLGTFLGIAAPALDEVAILRVLERVHTSFVKWDARPPNAVVTPEGKVAWFDWEHCGRRNRLDDIVWFLGDESIVDRPGDERRLLNRWVPLFDEGGYPAGPAEYTMAMGALHCAVRLANDVTNAARRESPDDWRVSLAGRGPASLSSGGLRMARRGTRWAEQSSVLAPLGPWFRAVRERFSAA